MSNLWLRTAILRELRKAGEAGVLGSALVHNIYGDYKSPDANKLVQRSIQLMRASGICIVTIPRSGRNARRFLRERDNP